MPLNLRVSYLPSRFFARLCVTDPMPPFNPRLLTTAMQATAGVREAEKRPRYQALGSNCALDATAWKLDSSSVSWLALREP